MSGWSFRKLNFSHPDNFCLLNCDEGSLHFALNEKKKTAKIKKLLCVIQLSNQGMSFLPGRQCCHRRTIESSAEKGLKTKQQTKREENLWDGETQIRILGQMPAGHVRFGVGGSNYPKKAN